MRLLLISNVKQKVRLNPKPSTIRRLDTLSGNECAWPTCKNKLVGEDDKSIISKICHISAASPGGPRYDAMMTDDQRRSFDNLILLCDEHHTIIDNKENEDKYPVELLKKWKRDHESISLKETSGKLLLSKYPLALNKVINFISERMDEVLDLPETKNAPNTDDKISYNHIYRYEPVIREFAPYQFTLNKIYEEIESEGSIKKILVLQNIKSIYFDIRKSYKEIEEIRPNADAIFDAVIDRIWEDIERAPNKLDEYDQETINFALMIVIVDAFMRCDILEEPIIVE